MSEEDEFTKTNVTYGVILRTDFETLQELKETIADFDGVNVVYQTTSAGKLHIEEGGVEDEEE